MWDTFEVMRAFIGAPRDYKDGSLDGASLQNDPSVIAQGTKKSSDSDFEITSIGLAEGREMFQSIFNMVLGMEAICEGLSADEVFAFQSEVNALLRTVGNGVLMSMEAGESFVETDGTNTI